MTPRTAAGRWSYLYDDYEAGTVFVTDDQTGEQIPLIEDITEGEAMRLVSAHNAALEAAVAAEYARLRGGDRG
jgi:hypothetical protein